MLVWNQIVQVGNFSAKIPALMCYLIPLVIVALNGGITLLHFDMKNYESGINVINNYNHYHMSSVRLEDAFANGKSLNAKICCCLYKKSCFILRIWGRIKTLLVRISISLLNYALHSYLQENTAQICFEQNRLSTVLLVIQSQVVRHPTPCHISTYSGPCKTFLFKVTSFSNRLTERDMFVGSVIIRSIMASCCRLDCLLLQISFCLLLFFWRSCAKQRR